MGRRVPFRLRLSVLDIVIPARVGKQSVIDFFIAVFLATQYTCVFQGDASLVSMRATCAWLW